MRCNDSLILINTRKYLIFTVLLGEGLKVAVDSNPVSRSIQITGIPRDSFFVAPTFAGSFAGGRGAPVFSPF